MSHRIRTRIFDASGSARVLRGVLYHSLALLTLMALIASPALAQTADLQVVHNAAGAGDVDIYVLDSGGSELAKLDDFPFRGALITQVPAAQSLTVSVNAASSTSATDQRVEAFSGITLTDGTFNQAFAVGASATAADFDLLLQPNRSRSASGGAGTVDLLIGHQSPDAPTVDVLTRGFIVADDLSYPNFSTPSGYVSVPTDDYIARVGPGDNSSFVASFNAALATTDANIPAITIDGSTVTVLASGFLSPGSSQPAFRLLVVPSENLTTTPGANTLTLASEPGLQTFIINEFFANPNTGDDANNDGTSGTSAEGDEFVEIVNVSGGDLSIEDYVIEDASGVTTYTFPATVIPDGQSATIFRGGSPTGIPNFVDVGLPALNNGGDTIFLKDPSGLVIDRIDYPTSGALLAPENDGESTTRSPDYFGPMVLTGTDLGTSPPYTPGSFNDGSQALPVELGTFTASLDGRDVVLNWTTLAETGNAGFDIQQRSGQGPFQVVGSVEGRGTTSSLSTYAFRVENLSPGTYQYRLRQIDVDGDDSFSETRSITVGLDRAFRLSKVAPHPVSASSSAVLQVQTSQPVTAELYDVLGRRVQTLFTGTMTPSTPQPLALDATALPSGVYFIRVRGTQFATTQRVTILR